MLLIKTGSHSPWRVGGVVSPPLGLMSLAAYARQHRPGQDVFRIEDTRLCVRDRAGWAHLLAEFRPDAIGLSALTVEMPGTRELAETLRTVSPGIPIVLGGPYASAVGAKALDDGAFDLVVAGEAENTFLRILEALDAGDVVPRGPASGLCARLPDGSVRADRPGSDVPVVEALPFPAWDLVDIEAYADLSRMSPFRHGRYAALFTSRGCPYRCTYCHEVFAKGFRAMSPARVVDEIAHLVDTYGIEEFEFFDDIFNADHDRALAVCNEIVARGLKIRMVFPNGLRGDRLTERLLVAMKEAGTVQISFAVETATPRLQKLIRKHMRLDAIAKNIEIAADLRIMTYGFFMVGAPTETLAEARATVDYAVGLPLHGAMFFVTMPYEGTEMHSQLVAGQFPVDASDLAGHDYQWDPNYGATTLSEMTPSQLRTLQRQAYARFYTRPGRVYRILRDGSLCPRDTVMRALRMARFALEGPRQTVLT